MPVPVDENFWFLWSQIFHLDIRCSGHLPAQQNCSRNSSYFSWNINLSLSTGSFPSACNHIVISPNSKSTQTPPPPPNPQLDLTFSTCFYSISLLPLAGTSRAGFPHYFQFFFYHSVLSYLHQALTITTAPDMFSLRSPMISSCEIQW